MEREVISMKWKKWLYAVAVMGVVAVGVWLLWEAGSVPVQTEDDALGGPGLSLAFYALITLPTLLHAFLGLRSGYRLAEHQEADVWSKRLRVGQIVLSVLIVALALLAQMPLSTNIFDVLWRRWDFRIWPIAALPVSLLLGWVAGERAAKTGED